MLLLGPWDLKIDRLAGLARLGFRWRLSSPALTPFRRSSSGCFLLPPQPPPLPLPPLLPPVLCAPVTPLWGVEAAAAVAMMPTSWSLAAADLAFWEAEGCTHKV